MNPHRRWFSPRLQRLLSALNVLALLLTAVTPAVAATSAALTTAPTGLPPRLAPAQEQPIDPNAPPDYVPTYEPIPEPRAELTSDLSEAPALAPDLQFVASDPDAGKTGVVPGLATAQLDPNGGQTLLGDLRLSVMAAAHAPTQPTAVTAEVLPATEAQALSPVGMAFRLRLDAQASTDAAPMAAAPTQPLTLTLDYSQIPMPFGGSFAARLVLFHATPCVQMDAAAQAADPEMAARLADPACRQWQALPSVSDPARQLLTVAFTATVATAAVKPVAQLEAPLAPDMRPALYLPLVAGPAELPLQPLTTNAGALSPGSELFVLAAGATSQYGAYNATPFATVSDYQVSLATGAFQTSYPIPVPPPPAGAAPSLALTYDSGSVDGMTSNKNSQPGWVGIGWSLDTGYITRHLKNCSAPYAPGDLCLAGDTYSIVLNGVASRLVKVDDSLYRLQHDPAWKVEKLTNGHASHPDIHKEYWLVTTPDGTKYRFGGEIDPESGADQNSAWYVPIYGFNLSGCNDPDLWMCNKTWQWNLDRIEDTNGNVTKFYYAIETNFYAARTYTAADPRYRREYVRAGYPARIEYGHRTGVNTATPPVRVWFTAEERCEGACVWPTNYPDTPGDLACAATGSCTQTAPTFWSRKRLDFLSTQYFDPQQGAYRNVARYDLAYQFPVPPNDEQGDPSEKKLWLESVTQRAGDGTGGLPPATYGWWFYANRAEEVSSVSSLLTPRIMTITTQLGGMVNVNYGQSHRCILNRSSSIRRPDDCGPEGFSNGGGGWGLANRWKVMTLTLSDSFSGNASQSTVYSYTTPIWHYDDNPAAPADGHVWNDFRGSEVVTVTNSSGVKTLHRFYRGMHDDQASSGDVYITLSDGTTRLDSNWLAGQEAETLLLSSTGARMQRTLNWFTSTATAGSGRTGAYFVGLQKTEQTLGNPTAPELVTRDEYTYDSFGNVTVEVHHGDLSTPTDDRTIQREFVPNQAAWIVNRPFWELLWQGNAPGNPVTSNADRATLYAYDNLVFAVPPTKGNVTVVRNHVKLHDPDEPSIDTQTAYDALGRPTLQTDGRGFTTATAYHLFHGYVTTVTNALGHQTVSTNDPGWGLPTSITDANGRVTTLQYDAYGRLAKVWKPTEPTNGPPSLEFVYAPASRPAWVKTRTLQSGSSYLDSWQFVDGFGRALQTQTPLAAGNRAVTYQRHNALGQLTHQSAPFAYSGAAGSNFIVPVWNEVPNGTLTYYDALNRITKVETWSLTTLLWDVESSYHGLTQTDTDAKGFVTKTTRNAFGMTTAVAETIGATGHFSTTTYTYDVQNNLLQVQDALGNLTTMTYDMLGRKRSMVDPDMGAWLYSYDRNSNLVSQRDGRGLWLFMEYDALNRLAVKRRDTAGSGPLVATYSYDAANQRGLPSRSRAYDSAGGYVESWAVTYDARNRLTQERLIVPGAGEFRFDYAYNAADARTYTNYPGGANASLGENVAYGYNAVGQLTSAAGSGFSYLTSATYNAQGKLLTQVNGGVVARLYTYESNTLRLATMTAGNNSPAFNNQQNLAYRYDNAGNVTSLVDAINSNQVQCFHYDTRHRLTAARTAAAVASCTTYAAVGAGYYTLTWGYNPIGNIIGVSGHPHTYSATQPHALAGAYGNSYAYDANGNQVSRTISGVTYTFTYDRENRLTEVKQGANPLASYSYDSSGKRVRSTVGGVTTITFNGIYEYVVGSGATTKYYEGNVLRRTGYAADNGVFYLLQDQLRSSSSLLTAAGALAPGGRAYYTPFGAARAGTLTLTLTSKHFTGQYHEANLTGDAGLYDYGARWYDPRIGRFLSPDSIVPEPGNPQDLNRYSYVRNNPTNLTDSSGHCVDGITTIACILAGVALITKGIDYGWTAWDLFQASRTLRNPSASDGDKLVAGVTVVLSVGLEAVEPDDILPIGVPLDDVARRTIVSGMRSAVQDGGLRGGVNFLTKSLGVSGAAGTVRALYDSGMFHGIRPAGEWMADLAGVRGSAGLAVHHILEKRFASLMGVEPNDIPGIVLTKVYHDQTITSELFKALPTGQTYNAQQIWNEYRRVYTRLGHMDWLDAIWPYFAGRGVTW